MAFPAVLVVDDFATLRRILRNQLTRIGFTEIEEAIDGASALAKLRSGSFGLVISNLTMEPMTGLQLLREIRGDTRLKGMPFIMVTEPKSDLVRASLDSGANTYIVKPLNSDELKAKIESVIGALS